MSLRPFCDYCGAEMQPPAYRSYRVLIDEQRSVQFEFRLNRGAEAAHVCEQCRIVQVEAALTAMMDERDKKAVEATKVLQEQIDSTKEKICP